jgi:acetophenone carboxylase
VIWTYTQKEAKLPTHAGLFGGYAETVVPGIRVTGTDVLARLASGDPDIPSDDIELITHNTLGGELHLEHQTRPATIMHRGELLCASTQGGGGYGDVLEREPERVLADLRGGVITRWVAEHVYCVAVADDGRAVEGEQTDRRRAAERPPRLARGQTWDDFHRDWDQLRPPDEALKYYGTWPDARKNREVIRI